MCVCNIACGLLTVREKEVRDLEKNSYEVLCNREKRKGLGRWKNVILLDQFSSVQSLSCVRHFATPRTAACQASLSITNSQSLLKLMFIKSVMPSNHLILCHPLLLLTLFFSFFFILFYFLTLQYCIGFAIYQHESTTGIHMFPIRTLIFPSIRVFSNESVLCIRRPKD